MDIFFLMDDIGRDDCNSIPCAFDIDSDGDVDEIDLYLFSEDFGRSNNGE